MKNTCLKHKYFDRFTCLKDKCPNSCCKDWQISIDKPTFKKYEKLEDKEFSKYLLENITHTNHVCLNKKVCPFLDDDCLCKIQKKYDENHLCNTCKTFPRFSQRYKNITRHDLYLSCPNTINLIKKYHNQKEYLKSLLKLNLEKNTINYLKTLKKLETKYKYNTNKKFQKIYLYLSQNNSNQNAFLTKNQKVNNLIESKKNNKCNIKQNENLKIKKIEFESIANFYSKLEILFASTNFTNNIMLNIKDKNLFTNYKRFSSQQKTNLEKDYKLFSQKYKKLFSIISNYYLNYYCFSSFKNQKFLKNFYIALTLAYMCKMIAFKLFIKEPLTFDGNIPLIISSFSKAVEHSNTIKQIKAKIKDLF